MGASSLGREDRRGFCGVERGISILMRGLLFLQTVSDIARVVGVSWGYLDVWATHVGDFWGSTCVELRGGGERWVIERKG